MNLLSKLFRRRPANMDTLELFRKIYGGSPASSGISVNAASAMQCGAVYACVRVLAESVAQLPAHVYRRTADGGKVRDDAHPLSRLLNRAPNNWQTAFEWRETMMGHLCLRGRAFSFVSRNGAGRVLSLIPLHPDHVTVSQNLDKSLSFEWRPAGGESQTFNQRQILYLRGMSSDSVNPLSPIAALREAVGLSVAAEKHGGRMFKNGAWFRGFLKHPGRLSAEARKNLKEGFDTTHSGDGAFTTPVLEEGVSYEKMMMTAEDMQFLETRKYQRSEIAMIFKVPPHMIGDLERATFSNIEHQSLEFVTHTMLPHTLRWEQAFWRDLIDDREKDAVFVELNVDGLLRADIKTRYAAYGMGIKDGWLSRNEARQKENLPPEDGLDEFLSPLNMATGNPPPAGDDPDPTDPDRPAK